MTTNYKAGDIRHTIAAIACAMVLGSTFLLGAVAPAQAGGPASIFTETAA